MESRFRNYNGFRIYGALSRLEFVLSRIWIPGFELGFQDCIERWLSGILGPLLAAAD